jgi:hypothetical protein
MIQTIPSTVMLGSSCGQLYASCNPPDSLDLDLLLLDAAGLPSLLSESLTLELLSGELDTSIPDFSFAYRPPPLTVVDLGERLHMWPHGWFRKPITTESERKDKVVLAAPTAPRLQSMLRENISISRWLVCFNHATSKYQAKITIFLNRNPSPCRPNLIPATYPGISIPS